MLVIDKVLLEDITRGLARGVRGLHDTWGRKVLVGAPTVGMDEACRQAALIAITVLARQGPVLAGDDAHFVQKGCKWIVPSYDASFPVAPERTA